MKKITLKTILLFLLTLPLFLLAGTVYAEGDLYPCHRPNQVQIGQVNSSYTCSKDANGCSLTAWARYVNTTDQNGDGIADPNDPGDQPWCDNNCAEPKNCPSNYCTDAGYHECTVGAPDGTCTKNGQTCSAFKTYECNYGGKNYCGPPFDPNPQTCVCSTQCSADVEKVRKGLDLADDGQANGSWDNKTCQQIIDTLCNDCNLFKGDPVRTTLCPGDATKCGTTGTCPADSNLTVSPNPAKVGDTMTFQYKAGEDVYIGGDSWSGGVSPNPCTLSSNLADRKYTCTAQTAVTNATWKHYWNTQQNCGSATYTITGSASPSPSPTGTTVAFRVAENPTDLEKAAWQTYTKDGMTVPFEFKDKTPGIKFVWVEFKDSKGNLERRSTQIQLLGNDPVITGCLLGFEGNNTILNLTGQNFGTAKGTAKSDETVLQIKEWKADSVKVIWPNAPLGQTLSVSLTNTDGQVAEGQCSAISQLAVGAKVFCRQPSGHQTDNVALSLAGKFTGGTLVRQKVSLDKEGVVQGLTQKLETDKEYQLLLKAPKSLRTTSEVFKAEEGTTNIADFVLPVGDIFPIDGGDSRINSLDKGELNRQFVLTQDFCSRTGDFNKDCRVNSIDWACMRASMRDAAGRGDDPEPVPGPPPSSPRPSPSVSPSPAAEVCIQVITPAKNPATGECKDFPTPCAVPAGWQKVASCSTN